VFQLPGLWEVRIPNVNLPVVRVKNNQVTIMVEEVRVSLE
jgi:hypothetical protein